MGEGLACAVRCLQRFLTWLLPARLAQKNSSGLLFASGVHPLLPTPPSTAHPTPCYCCCCLQAGARICTALGQDCLPYLQLVMPPLLAAAQLKPDVIVSDSLEGDDDDEEAEEDDGDVSRRRRGPR